MTGDYWLGVATPFVAAFVAWVAVSVAVWIAWWFRDGRTFRGGWGYTHEFQYRLPENGRWGMAQHTHWWPPDTPRWLGRLLEPARIHICLRDPEHRPAEVDER